MINNYFLKYILVIRIVGEKSRNSFEVKGIKRVKA